MLVYQRVSHFSYFFGKDIYGCYKFPMTQSASVEDGTHVKNLKTLYERMRLHVFFAKSKLNPIFEPLVSPGPNFDPSNIPTLSYYG
jgi:hypothetical protein